MHYSEAFARRLAFLIIFFVSRVLVYPDSCCTKSLILLPVRPMTAQPNINRLSAAIKHCTGMPDCVLFSMEPIYYCRVLDGQLPRIGRGSQCSGTVPISARTMRFTALTASYAAFELTSYILEGQLTVNPATKAGARVHASPAVSP